MSGPVKLKITPTEGRNKNKAIVVPFNPNKFTVGKTVSWTGPGGKASDSAKEEKTNSSMNAMPLVFNGGEGRTLGFDLLFDTTEETGDQDVRNKIKPIVSLSRIDRDLKRPPVCTITWGPDPKPGSDFPFTGVLSELSEVFSLFSSTGVPLRVTLTLKFKEWLDPKQDMLLTDPDFTTRLYKRGDSLSSLAADAYKDPTKWRVIAEANSLDDARNVPIGLRLNVPKVG